MADVSATDNSAPAPIARAGVVGLGPMGIAHLRAWQRLLGAGNVVAVARHARDHRRLADAGLAAVATVDSAGELPQCTQWASVCAPTPHHAEVALPLLAAGLDAIVEKPLAANIDDAEALAAQGPGRCFVAHNCRVEGPALAVLREVPQLGALTAIVCHRAELSRDLPAATPPQARYGRLFDVLVHDLSAVLDLLGPGEPISVEASWRARDQTMTASWSWPGLSLAITQARAAVRPTRSVTIAGSLARAGWSFLPGARSAWLELDGNRREIACSFGDATSALIAECVSAQLAGRRSFLAAAAGVRTMRLAALALQALPAGTFGADRFDWSFVR